MFKKTHFYVVSSQKAGDRKFLTAKEKDIRKYAGKWKYKMAL